ncbi:MAG: zinc ribbon domain-containing protein [Nitrospirales bacterium]|nr:zinc ribbon domain-containing protein [Nitrospira sp.]MDR4500620.1 zinc ribbon domain-containing protein [Nitrospirales bacterium]
MPIFSYICQECSHHFDQIVQGSTIPQCPQCQATTLEKQLSAFAVGGNDEGTVMGGGPGACGSCGDPRGPGACSLN